MNLKEKKEKEEEAKATKSEGIDDFVDSATLDSPISQFSNRMRHNILDQDVPDFRDHSPLLLPRSPLQSPPASTSTPVTLSPPPVGPRMLQAARLAYPHLSGSRLLQAARSFNPILSAPQRGANYENRHGKAFTFDNFSGNNFAREEENDIEQETGYEKGRGKAFSFGNFGRNDFAKEGADEMEHETNLARTDLDSTSRDMAPLIPSLVKQKPRLHMDLHFPDLPVLSPRQANRYEEIMEPSTPRSRLAGPVSPPKPPQGYRSTPQDFGVPPPTTQQLEESDNGDDSDAVDWNAKNYLGPLFPSMSRDVSTGRRCYREEQRELQVMINEELQNIHRLENNINKTIYGAASDNPCTMLDYQEVVYAATAPELLATNPKKQIAMMKNVMKMMEDAKAHHQGVLAQLQVPPPPPPRQSDRLQKKQKRDFRRFDREGY